MPKKIEFAYNVDDLTGGCSGGGRRRRGGNGNGTKQSPSKRKNNSSKSTRLERIRRHRQKSQKRIQQQQQQQQNLRKIEGNNESASPSQELEEGLRADSAETTTTTTASMSSSSCSGSKADGEDRGENSAVDVMENTSSSSSAKNGNGSPSKNQNEMNTPSKSKLLNGSKNSLFQTAISAIQKANQHGTQQPPSKESTTLKDGSHAMDATSTSSSSSAGRDGTKSSCSQQSSATTVGDSSSSSTSATHIAAKKTSTVVSASLSSNASVVIDVTSPPASSTVATASGWSKRGEKRSKTENEGWGSKAKTSGWGQASPSPQKGKGWGCSTTATTTIDLASSSSSAWSSPAKKTTSSSWGQNVTSPSSIGKGWGGDSKASKVTSPGSSSSNDGKQSACWGNGSKGNDRNLQSTWGHPTRHKPQPNHRNYTHSPSSPSWGSPSRRMPPRRIPGMSPQFPPPDFFHNSPSSPQRRRPPPHRRGPPPRNIHMFPPDVGGPEMHNYPPRSIRFRHPSPPPYCNHSRRNGNRKRSCHYNNANHSDNNNKNALKHNRRGNHHDDTATSSSTTSSSSTTQLRYNAKRRKQNDRDEDIQVLNTSNCERKNAKEKDKHKRREDDNQKDIQVLDLLQHESQSSSSKENAIVNLEKDNLLNETKEEQGIVILDDEDETKGAKSKQDGNDVVVIWDNPNIAKKKNNEDEITMLNVDNNEDVTIIATKKAPKSRQDLALDQIVEVLPDVDPDHVRTLLSEQGIDPNDEPEMNEKSGDDTIKENDGDVVFVSSSGSSSSSLRDNIAIQAVLAKLLQSGQSYPKRKTPSIQNNHIDSNTTQQEISSTKVSASYMYDYTSTAAFTPSHSYKTQCIDILMDDFPFLSKDGVILHFNACGNRYYQCHVRICGAITNGFFIASSSSSLGNNNEKSEGDEIRASKILTEAMKGLATLDPDMIERLRVIQPTTTATGRKRSKNVGKNTTIKRPRITKLHDNTPNLDSILKDEVRYTKAKLNEWLSNIKTKEELQKVRNESNVLGTTIECQCCYGDYAFEEMVSCRDEGHLFCMDCLRRHAEERIFGVGKLGWGGGGETGKGSSTVVEQTPELLCMHSDGCHSVFQREQLKRALPDKIMAKYDELQFTMAVEKAGVEDMCKCPKCDFQAVLPPSEMIYHCPSCDYESCRKCGEPPHIPLKCSEVEKEHETQGRKTVEEAMTAARIRTCPRPTCKKEFFKVEGCNKMTCACGINICYVCRAEIPKSVGYQHFCQTPHCKHDGCNKCPLYSNAKEDDERAMREAGLKAAKEVQEKNLHGGGNISDQNAGNVSSKRDSSKGEVRIDVDALLKDPAKSETKKSSSRDQAVRPPPGGRWGRAGEAVVQGGWGHGPRRVVNPWFQE